MHDDGYFDERVAARYDEPAAESDAEAIDPLIDFLVDIAGNGRALEIVDGRVERLSIPFRYAWPSELDLMAQLAGMELRERWSGWRREPFTSDSRKHVSVWQKPGARTQGAE